MHSEGVEFFHVMFYILFLTFLVMSEKAIIFLCSVSFEMPFFLVGLSTYLYFFCLTLRDGRLWVIDTYKKDIGLGH